MKRIIALFAVFFGVISLVSAAQEATTTKDIVNDFKTFASGAKPVYWSKYGKGEVRCAGGKVMISGVASAKTGISFLKSSKGPMTEVEGGDVVGMSIKASGSGKVSIVVNSYNERRGHYYTYRKEFELKAAEQELSYEFLLAKSCSFIVPSVFVDGDSKVVISDLNVKIMPAEI